MRIIHIVSVVLALFCSTCYCQSPKFWDFEINSVGRKTLKGYSKVSTPNGLKNCVLSFSKTTGETPGYSVDFRVANASEIKNFHFDDFEGPAASVRTKLMSVSVSGPGVDNKYSFCPNGAYVDEPKDGFYFGSYIANKNNPILSIIKEAAKGVGVIKVKVIDSKNSKISLSAEFNLASCEVQFQKFIH